MKEEDTGSVMFVLFQLNPFTEAENHERNTCQHQIKLSSDKCYGLQGKWDGGRRYLLGDYHIQFEQGGEEDGWWFQRRSLTMEEQQTKWGKESVGSILVPYSHPVPMEGDLEINAEVRDCSSNG